MQPMTLTLMLAAGLALLPAPADAQAQTVIHRCTSTDGAVSLQSMPCPAGSQSQVRRLSADYAPPPVPAYTSPARTSDAPPAASQAPAAASDVPAAAQAAVDRPVRPLPLLHQCRPRQGAAYYTDDLARSVRCLPLRVTGLDGNPATGAGQACEVQRDVCQPVDEEATCQAWADYLAQSRQAFATAPSRSSAATDTDSAQIALLIAGSACAGPATQNP